MGFRKISRDVKLAAIRLHERDLLSLWIFRVHLVSDFQALARNRRRREPSTYITWSSACS
ncbi:hypothetical protein BDR07DRAFT_1556966 [Suillus spraguei]|nr:hypothetical protein BDR07DRAFT_1556966 [Suillus spraguei]